MKQYILPPEFSGEDHIILRGSSSRYLLKVLRHRKGDSLPAADRSGGMWTLTITETGRDYLAADCIRTRTPEAGTAPTADRRCSIVLLQCLPKGKKLDLIVRQAVEAGVSAIVTVESDNTVPVIKQERSVRQAGRLEKICEEAAQQSGNPGIPKLYPAVRLKELPSFLCSEIKADVKLFFHQEDLDKGSLHGYLIDNPESAAVLIGPEGGFSPEETEFLLASGFHPVYLGKNVLRTETAAIYALGAVNTILLENKEWKITSRE